MTEQGFEKRMKEHHKTLLSRDLVGKHRIFFQFCLGEIMASITEGKSGSFLKLGAN